ncbi:MAG: class I SAM-dependent methyltransferase [Bacteroidota bacterium]
MTTATAISSVINLGEVQETLLIPLYGRAVESSLANGMLYDPLAERIIDEIDYDFGRLAGKPSLKGAVLRTLTYDFLIREVMEYMPAQSPTIVELGCGLNTRRSRMGLQRLLWYDLDMPDVYELWQQFFSEQPNHVFLPYSAFDEQWAEVVRDTSDGPYIFVSEASTAYFSEASNKKLFQILGEYFPGCYYIFDTANDYFIKRQDKHDVLKYYDARIKWCVNDISELNRWGLNIRHIQTINFFADPPEELADHIPTLYKAITAVMKFFNHPALNQYQLQVCQINS